jgi:hypothetical protein
MKSKVSVEQISPFGGDAVGRRGAFPSGEARLYGFSAAAGGKIFIARRAIPQPSAPQALSNLRTLTAPGRVHLKNLSMQMNKKFKNPVDRVSHPWCHHTCRRESGGPDEVFLQKT